MKANERYIAIDLGSSNTLIYSSETDSVIFNEPTVIARNIINNQVLDIGYIANKIQGRAPYNVTLNNFVRNGIINSMKDCIDFFNNIVQTMHLEKTFRSSNIIFCCPDTLSEVQQECYINLSKFLGAKEVYLESSAKLTALGAGVNLFNPQGTLVLNIGSEKTDVGIIASGEVVKSKTFFLGGYNFDRAIIKYIREKWQTKVGYKTAESIKHLIGNLVAPAVDKTFEVKGQDLITGLPHSFILSSIELVQALEPVADAIVDEIQYLLEDISPELIADIVQNGVLLSGGTSQLQNLRKYLEDKLNFKVYNSSTPNSISINGAKELIYTNYLNKDKNKNI